MSEYDGASPGSASPDVVRRGQTGQKTLLFVAPSDMIASCLLDAVEHEFPGFAVVQVPDLKEACAVFRHPVALTFVDASYLAEIDDALPALQLHHPQAAVVLMYDDAWHSSGGVDEILSQGKVRSILPMNLKLDLWLLVIRILLRGGEYFPPSLMRTSFRQANGTPPGPKVEDTSARPAGRESRGLGHLTHREMEILEMVARGYQNKVIAAEFKLSEHTVKVHLHNIIKKLGTHNRTSAAAIFLANSTTPRNGSREAITEQEK